MACLTPFCSGQPGQSLPVTGLRYYASQAIRLGRWCRRPIWKLSIGLRALIMLSRLVSGIGIKLSFHSVSCPSRPFRLAASKVSFNIFFNWSIKWCLLIQFYNHSSTVFYSDSNIIWISFLFTFNYINFPSSRYHHLLLLWLISLSARPSILVFFCRICLNKTWTQR